MGTSICNTTDNQPQPEIHFLFAFAEDTREPTTPHHDTLLSNNKHLDIFLKDCQDKLKISNRLYKDPGMKTDSIILKSLTKGQNQVVCTYERPYVFLGREYSDVEKRIYKIIDEKQSKSNQVQVKDPILQYFGVFLCYIADHPQLLRNILLTEPNSYGLYVAQVNIRQRKQYIYFDDYTLCHKRMPIFSQPINKTYIWPCLLQKVWFKVKQIGSKKIQRLEPEDVISTFLSNPTKTFHLSNENRYQDNVKILQEQLHVMERETSNGCIVTTKQNPGHKLGISGNKYFYLIKIIQYENKRLYYLRNPCGGEQMDFRGTYSNLSKQLSSLLKRQTQEQAIQEGNILLDQQEFIEQIESFTIIYHSEACSVINQQVINMTNFVQTFVMVEVKAETRADVFWRQYSQRQTNSGNSTGNNSSNGLYIPIMYHMVCLADGELLSDEVNEQGCFGVASTHFFKKGHLRLKKGSYLIRIKKKPAKRSMNELQTSDKLVIAAGTKLKIDYNNQNLFAQNFKEFLRKKGHQMVQQRRVSKFRSQFEHIGFWSGDLAVVYIQRKVKQDQRGKEKEKEGLKMQVHFPEIVNLECLSHPQVKRDYVSIEPLVDYILLIFEKVQLAAETVLGRYSIDSY